MCICLYLFIIRPKITSVSGYDESSGRSIVTTMMHDSDEAMEPDVAQWMDGNPEKHVIFFLINVI